MNSRICLANAILLETETLLAVLQPADLLGVPDRWDKTKENLMALLQAERPDQYLANVHRLDRDTTGVFLVAKTRDTFRDLVRQFRDRLTRKLYVGLVAGAVCGEPRLADSAPNRDRELAIDLPIGPNPRLPGHSRIDHKHGQPARSTVRVHLQGIGHPPVGDAAYGGGPLLLSQLKRKYKSKADAEERPLLARPALHAASLTLADPPVTITAPLPKDLEVALKYLRKFAAG
jgi:23S rRNA-/tRNA-specific pseudouridylate synthase